jgi:hypothetical protein
MKILNLGLATCLFTSGAFAQSTSINKYCVDVVNGKTVVMHNNKMITVTVNIDSMTQLLVNGVVVWDDKSTTILRHGDCIDESGIVYSERKETDFIGDTNALNHIHMLPEATVTAEKKTNKSEMKNYMLYMEKLYKDIDVNDFEITFIKQKLQTLTKQETTKFRKKLNSLEKENMELKISFDIFVHFGIMDDWHLFRAEMNGDLKPLVQDIAMMKGELQVYGKR